MKRSYNIFKLIGVLCITSLFVGCGTQTTQLPQAITSVTEENVEVSDIYNISQINVNAFTKNDNFNSMKFVWSDKGATYLDFYESNIISNFFEEEEVISNEDQNFIIDFVNNLPTTYTEETTKDSFLLNGKEILSGIDSNYYVDNYKDKNYICTIEVKLTNDKGDTYTIIRHIFDEYPTDFEKFANIYNKIIGEDVLSNYTISEITPEFIEKHYQITEDMVINGTLQDVIDYYKITPSRILANEITFVDITQYCEQVLLQKIASNNVNRLSNEDITDEELEQYTNAIHERWPSVEIYKACEKNVFNDIDDEYIYFQYYDNSISRTRYICSKDGKFIITLFEESGNFAKDFYDLEYAKYDDLDNSIE